MGQLGNKLPLIAIACFALTATTLGYMASVSSDCSGCVRGRFELADKNAISSELLDRPSNCANPIKDDVGVLDVLGGGCPFKIADMVISWNPVNVVYLRFVEGIGNESLSNETSNVVSVIPAKLNARIAPDQCLAKYAPLAVEPFAVTVNHCPIKTTNHTAITNLITFNPSNFFPCFHSISPLSCECYNMGHTYSQQQNVTSVTGGQ